MWDSYDVHRLFVYTLMDLYSISVSSLASEGHKQSLLTLLQEEQVEQQ